MKIKSSLRAAALGGAIALTALAGGVSQSQAAVGGFKGLSNLNAEAGQSQIIQVGKKRLRHGHRFFKFKKFNHGHDCSFYKWKWHHTGSFFWKKKYFVCKGWW